VLEYGCGDGKSSYVFELAARGAQVIGIDLSYVAMRMAEAEGKRRSLSGLEFHVMNAEDLEFPDGTFDLICGSAILHHLDLRRSFGELARTLNPSGIAVFGEPLGHNVFINLYRMRTPGLRTPDEHPMRMEDMGLAQQYFEQVEFRAFYLLPLFAVPLRHLRFYPRLRSLLSAADDALFSRAPFLKRYAWYSVLVLSRPRAR
jgi:SAM-dependent methyltransferase